MEFSELHRVSSAGTFNFFSEKLSEVVGTEACVAHQAYVASILASYAQTARDAQESFPFLSNLADLFDFFVVGKQFTADPDTLEAGGAQALLYNGFFRNQMKGRHNVDWFDEIGGNLYLKAADLLTHPRDSKRMHLFDSMGKRFSFWTKKCSELARLLEDERLLIRLN